MPPSYRPYGQDRDGAPREQRARGHSGKRLYGAAWRKARSAWLAEHPLCRYCELEGRVTLASVVDHLYPHNGNAAIFWRSEHWVSSCAECHSGFKQSLEAQGRAALDRLAQRLNLPPMAAASRG